MEYDLLKADSPQAYAKIRDNVFAHAASIPCHDLVETIDYAMRTSDVSCGRMTEVLNELHFLITCRIVCVNNNLMSTVIQEDQEDED